MFFVAPYLLNYLDILRFEAANLRLSCNRTNQGSLPIRQYLLRPRKCRRSWMLLHANGSFTSFRNFSVLLRPTITDQ